MEAIGRYQILGKLGEGGMGAVYLAEDPTLGRRVAIKLISNREMDADRAAFLRSRFLQEARTTARLTHPHVISIHDLGEEQGAAYIVMEYAPGITLSKLARTRQLGTDELLSILRQTAAGLDYAHSMHVVHRDIKPANLIVDENGTVKIADFGIAKVSDATQTSTGIVMGTIQYIAPEQLRGDPVDGRTDQYALASLTYEMLAGVPVFQADTPGALTYRICHQDPVRPNVVRPNLPAEIGPVFDRALAKQNSDRFPTCSAFVAALSAALHGYGDDCSTVTIVPPAVAGAHAGKSTRPKAWVLGGAAASLVCVLAAGVIFYRNSRVEPSAPRVQAQAAGNPQTSPVAHQPDSTTASAPNPAVPVVPAPDPVVTAPPPSRPAKQAQPHKKEEVRSEVPSQDSAALKPAAKDGRIVWTGELENGQEIDFGDPSIPGSLSSRLPGIPVSIEVHPAADLRIVTPPGPGNGWRHLVLHNDGKKQLSIIVVWTATGKSK